MSGKRSLGGRINGSGGGRVGVRIIGGNVGGSSGGGNNFGGSSGGNGGGSSGGGKNFGGGHSFTVGGRRGGGSSGSGGRDFIYTSGNVGGGVRSFNGTVRSIRAGGNNGGGRSFHRSGGGGRSLSGSDKSADGNGIGGGRTSGSSHVGGRQSVSGRGTSRIGRNHEPDSSDDDTYEPSSEDSGEDDQFDDGDSGDDEIGVDGDDNVGSGDEGGGIVGSETESDDGDDITYSKRGYSLGIYARKPRRPQPIRMAKKVIDNPTASRTLLALTRIYWPVGCIGIKDIDRRCPYWWKFMRKLFFKYYTYDPKYGTEQDARRAISYHLHNNIRKNQASERKRVLKLIKEKGGTFHDYRPPYFSEPVWKIFADYWESPVFQRRSTAARENRKKQRTHHKSGATSYRRRAWDILEKTGEEPGEYDLFMKMNTDAAGAFTTEGAAVIVKRFLSLCEKQNMDPSYAPIRTWADAVGVRKNGIMGVPRTKASDIIPIKRKRRRQCRDEESGASTNGRSVHMADAFVIQTVDQTVAYARAHPEEFGLAPEQVCMLEQSVSVTECELPSNHPLSKETMTELVRVMVSVLNDIQTGHNKSDNNKGKSIAHEDGSSSNRSDDDIFRACHSPPQDRRGKGIYIRGD